MVATNSKGTPTGKGGRSKQLDLLKMGLSEQTKDKLSQMAASLQLAGRSKLKKDELVDRLAEVLIEKPHADRLELLGRYSAAASELYGALSLPELAEVFNQHHPDAPVTEEELRLAVKLLQAKPQAFDLVGDIVVSDYFFMEKGDEELDRMLTKARGKPLYVPAKEEFLRYAEPDYWERMPQAQRLHQYVWQHMSKDKQRVDALVDNLQLTCSMELPIGELLKEFENLDLVFQHEKQVHEVVALVTDLYNNTRMWSNRGHTPVELGQLRAAAAPAVPTALLRDPIAAGAATAQAGGLTSVLAGNQEAAAAQSALAAGAVVKIGRNEPCPCGSGRKHKKCCG